MGSDSIHPFLKKKERGVFLLAKTSNPSADVLQNVKQEGLTVFERVIQMANNLNQKDNIGLVVGATVTKDLQIIRDHSPGMPILIPGVGAQGGDLVTSMRIGNQNGIGLINISRSISFSGDMSSESIKKAASNYASQMFKAIT